MHWYLYNAIVFKGSDVEETGKLVYFDRMFCCQLRQLSRFNKFYNPLVLSFIYNDHLSDRSIWLYPV
jgi:hypothetical protein